MKNLFLIFFISGLVLAQNIKHQSAITINNAWMRPAGSETNSALFFEVENKSEKSDSLISVDFKFAEAVQIHETYKQSDDMMGMREVKGLAIPAKTTVRFKPRGLHVMLLNLSRDLKRGQKYDVILLFKNAGRIKIDANVKEMPPIK